MRSLLENKKMNLNAYHIFFSVFQSKKQKKFLSAISFVLSSPNNSIKARVLNDFQISTLFTFVEFTVWVDKIFSSR